MKKERIDVCIPVYNMEEVIRETIESALSQTQKRYGVIVVDNCSTDNTAKVIASIKDKRLKFYQNKENIGFARNMLECIRRSTADIVVLLSADDILRPFALEKVYNAFQMSKKIGCVTRPHYFFDVDKETPIRETRQFQEDVLVSLNHEPSERAYSSILDAIALSSQLSGLGYRKKFLSKTHSKYLSRPFIEIASMFLPVLRKSDVVILKENTVAVRTTHSGAQNPAAYKYSPAMSWHLLVEDVLHEEKFAPLRKYLDDKLIANNFIGLVQVRSSGGLRALVREIGTYLKLRAANAVNVKFWAYALGLTLLPSSLITFLTPLIKRHILPLFLNRNRLLDAEARK